MHFFKSYTSVFLVSLTMFCYMILEENSFLNKYNMGYQVVTNLKIMSDIKTCPYFRVNLGLANTVDTQQGRVMRETDGFQHFYNTTYKTTIFGQGNIGDIMFYVDHYIKDDVLAFYLDNEEFVYQHDPEMIKEKGVSFFLGDVLRRMEEDMEERIKKEEEKKIESEERKVNANPDKILENPGAVSFDDLQAYLDKKNRDRYSTESE